MLRVVCSAGHHDLALLAVIWSICVFSAGWLNLWAGLQTLSVKDMGSRDDVVALWFAGAISYCAAHGVRRRRGRSVVCWGVLDVESCFI